MVNKKSPLPLYYQIEEHIKALIESGELKPGDVLPSERELAESFTISRMTVRQAITNLVNKNLLYRKKGSGTYVSHKKFEQSLHGLTSFSEDMRSRGLDPGNKLIHFELSSPTEELIDHFTLEEDDLVYKIKRIRLANGEPMAIETSYIPVKLLPGLSQKVLSSSLYRYAEEENGIKLGHATQSLEASAATEEDAKHLQLDAGDPVLFIQRETFLEDGAPFELVKSTYRGDKYKYKMNIERLR
ncbi:GntR family transcriptional regulator [Rossellomorea aquimaris]|uniref:GntR family transcriptional regulator n=1 Tax=Rossellomorea aquimaris TaxID=189382 RepID=UPI001CD1A0D9|nr:GntR family transcriptional regulator [Rossellomorea aquimaris]MCA1055665.1 GntR family transcriptional regulator [Rossellomorea aquimaris]